MIQINQLVQKTTTTQSKWINCFVFFRKFNCAFCGLLKNAQDFLEGEKALFKCLSSCQSHADLIGSPSAKTSHVVVAHELCEKDFIVPPDDDDEQQL